MSLLEYRRLQNYIRVRQEPNFLVESFEKIESDNAAALFHWTVDKKRLKQDLVIALVEMDNVQVLIKHIPKDPEILEMISNGKLNSSSKDLEDYLADYYLNSNVSKEDSMKELILKALKVLATAGKLLKNST
jgi:hypothetical protein